MGLLGGDLWDEIVDPHDRKKKKADWSPKIQKPKKNPKDEMEKSKVSGLTIFYRTIGCIILLGTMIKSWIVSPTIFDWILLLLSILLLGIHRRLGAEHVVERIKPAFLDLHNRIERIETKLTDDVIK